MAISLRQLRIFEATARLNRLTAAADEQALSQSAASQALKELELALDYPLFNRSRRELLITDSGQQVLPRVRQILELVDGLKCPQQDSFSGPLRLVASVTISSSLLPKLLAEFITRHPDVEPELQIVNTRRVIETLEKGQAHVGLIEGPAVHSQLQIIPWKSDQLVVFCRPDHPLAHDGLLHLKQIPAQRWVLREAGSGTRAVFDQALQRLGAQAKVVLALNRQEAIKQSVKAGLGIGCLSQLSVAEEVAAGELVILGTPLDLNRQLSLVVWPEAQSSCLSTAFVDFLLHG
ncbi:MAG: LysR family transcriptional regulator [Motiliproteus sp.]